ncbi:MAG: hypothetical protein ABSA79_09755, partial [Candidatus Bathyarchaeia archaeon]
SPVVGTIVGISNYPSSVVSPVVGTIVGISNYPSSVVSPVVSTITGSTNGPPSSIATPTVNVIEGTVTTIASPLVAPTVKVSPVTVDVGQSAVLSVVTDVSGGTGPFSYQWMSEAPGASSYSTLGSATSSASSPSTGALSLGSWKFELQVTDATTASVTSNVVSVLVNSVLVAPTVTPTPPVLDQGQSVALTITPVTTGTAPYSYQWYARLGSGSWLLLTGATEDHYGSGFGLYGTMSYLVQVTDSAGAAVNSSAVSVTINPAPAASVTPVGPLTMYVGQPQLFTCAASGGTGTLSYQWYLDGVAVFGVAGTGSTFTFTPAAAGSPAIYCNVTDSASTPYTVQSNTPSVTVDQITVEIVTITPANSYLSSQSVTVSGPGVSVTSIPMDGLPHTFTADPLSTITFTVSSDLTDSRYRFNSAGSSSTTWSYTTGSPGGTDTESNTVYYQLLETFQYSITNTPAGTPSTGPMVTFNQIGSPKSSDTAALYPSTSSTDWVDYSSSSTAITYANPLGVSTSTERWQAFSVPTFAATSYATLNPIYYHQFSVTFQYSIANSPAGTPTNPTATFTVFGGSTTDSAKLSAGPTDWVNAGSSVTYTNPIAGVSGERWMVSGGATPYVASLSVTAFGTLNPSYYHQFQVILQYHVVNSPAGTPTVTNIVSFTGFGVGSAATPVLASATSSQVWADAGSGVTYASPIASGGERWMVTSSDSGTYTVVSSVTAAATENPGYYHQYLETVSILGTIISISRRFLTRLVVVVLLRLQRSLLTGSVLRRL